MKMQQIKATQNRDGTYKVEILDYNFNNEKVTTIIPRAQISITVYNSLDPEGELYTIEVENEREDTSIKPDFCGTPCGFMGQIVQDLQAKIESLKKKVEEFEDREAALEANDY